LAELGGKEDTDRGTELELVLLDVDGGEEPVQVVDREEEHLRSHCWSSHTSLTWH
jgi:hypothetical protein